MLVGRLEPPALACLCVLLLSPAGCARLPLSVAPAALPAPGPPARADAAPQPFFASRASRVSTAAAPAAAVAVAAAQPVGAARAPAGAPSGEAAPAFQAPALVAPQYVQPLSPAAAPEAPPAPRERRSADGVFLVELDSAELINGTHMYLWGMPAAVSWVQRTAGGLRSGALPSQRFLSPALANAADAGDSRTGWLDGPDAALRGFCCGGKAVLVLVSLEDPGYAPEAGAAYFSFSVLPADATPRLVGGTVGAALDAQSAAAADSDVGADPDLPTLVTVLPDSVVLEAATLSIDAVFTTPRLAALRMGGAAPSAAAQAAAAAETPSVGTKDAQVALPPPGTVGSYDGAGGALYGQGLTAAAAARAGATPVPATPAGTLVSAQSVTSAPASTPTPTACTSSTPGCPGYNPAKDPDCQGYQAMPRAKCLQTSSPTPTPSQTAVRSGASNDAATGAPLPNNNNVNNQASTAGTAGNSVYSPVNTFGLTSPYSYGYGGYGYGGYGYPGYYGYPRYYGSGGSTTPAATPPPGSANSGGNPLLNPQYTGTLNSAGAAAAGGAAAGALAAQGLGSGGTAQASQAAVSSSRASAAQAGALSGGGGGRSGGSGALVGGGGGGGGGSVVTRSSGGSGALIGGGGGGGNGGGFSRGLVGGGGGGGGGGARGISAGGGARGGGERRG